MDRGEVNEAQLQAIERLAEALTSRPGASIVCLSRRNATALIACIHRLSKERLEAKKSASRWCVMYHAVLAAGRTTVRLLRK